MYKLVGIFRLHILWFCAYAYKEKKKKIYQFGGECPKQNMNITKQILAKLKFWMHGNVQD